MTSKAFRDETEPRFYRLADPQERFPDEDDDASEANDDEFDQDDDDDADEADDEDLENE